MFSTRDSIILSFDQIAQDDHSERMLFIEQHRSHIYDLDEEAKYYLTYHYVHSLHHCGKYSLFLDHIDPLVEHVFLNKTSYTHKASYLDLLYLKADAHLRLMRYESSIYILHQLIGIDPGDLRAQHLLKKAYIEEYNYKTATAKISALLLILLGSIIGAIIWWLRERSVEYTLSSNSIYLIIAPCVTALLIIGGTNMLGRYRAAQKVTKFVAVKRLKNNYKSNSIFY